MPVNAVCTPLLQDLDTGRFLQYWSNLTIPDTTSDVRGSTGPVYNCETLHMMLKLDN